MYRTLFTFMTFFFFSVSTVSHPSLIPSASARDVCYNVIKMLLGHFFQAYSLLKVGEPQSVSWDLLLSSSECDWDF